MMIFNHRPPIRTLCFCVGAGLAAITLGGCATGDISMVATIYSGEKIRVPVGSKGIGLTREDGVQTALPTFAFDADKKLVFTLAFTAPANLGLSKVSVEDVTDEKAMLVAEDAAPALKQGRWSGTSRPLGKEEPLLRWVFHVDNSLRIYRFTLTQTDGSKRVLYQGVAYPDWLKSGARQVFGEKY